MINVPTISSIRSRSRHHRPHVTLRTAYLRIIRAATPLIVGLTPVVMLAAGFFVGLTWR